MDLRKPHQVSQYTLRRTYTTTSGEKRVYVSTWRVASKRRLKITDEDMVTFLASVIKGVSFKAAAAARGVALTALTKAAIHYAAQRLRFRTPPLSPR